MENLRKIKKMNEQKAEKVFAMTQLAAKKGKKSEETSFLVGDKEKAKVVEGQNEEQKIFFIRNLDDNKVEVVDHEQKINRIIQELDQLPEIQKLLDKIWEQYINERQKQEELFLQACYQGNVNMIKKVVTSKSKHPIDPATAQTDQGKNGIHLATVSGSYRNAEIISVLVDFSVDINGRTKNQLRTPLMLGSILGNEVAVKALISLGANHELQDYQGNTALHLACGYNQQQIVQILLENKCSIEIKNNKGQTPIDCVSSQQLYQSQKQIYEPKSLSQQTTTFKDEIQSKQADKYKCEFDDKNPDVRKKGREQRINQVIIKEIGLSSFKKISLLGKGAFGQVFLVENNQDGKRYAMKILDKGMIMRQNILRYAMTERKILSTINHPFVVRLHYAFQSTDKLFLVMQYCPGGDILRIIKKNGRIDEKTTRKYVAEIILAIEELHKAEIIYRDLKPGNVVLDPDGHACLTDFGLAKEASLSHSFCGSTAYLAPEMLWRRGHTKVLDWYLLGVFIYECLSGKPPFWDTNKQQLLSNIKSGQYKQLGSEFSKEARDLVQKLLRSNSSKRLGVNGSSQLKAHPWFKNIDWKIVEAKEQVMEKIEPIVGKPIKQQHFDEPEIVHNKIKGWDFAPSQ